MAAHQSVACFIFHMLLHGTSGLSCALQILKCTLCTAVKVTQSGEHFSGHTLRIPAPPWLLTAAVASSCQDYTDTQAMPVRIFCCMERDTPAPRVAFSSAHSSPQEISPQIWICPYRGSDLDSALAWPVQYGRDRGLITIGSASAKLLLFTGQEYQLAIQLHGRDFSQCLQALAAACGNLCADFFPSQSHG